MIKFANADGTCGKWTNLTVYRSWFGSDVFWLEKQLRFFSYTQTGNYREQPTSTNYVLNYTRTYSKAEATWGNVTQVGGGLGIPVATNSISFFRPPVAIQDQVNAASGTWVITNANGAWAVTSFAAGPKYSITVNHSRPGVFAFAEAWTDENDLAFMRAVCESDLDAMKAGSFVIFGNGGTERRRTTDTPSFTQIGGVSLDTRRVAMAKTLKGIYMILRRSTIWQCGNHKLQLFTGITGASTCSNFMICGGANCTSLRKDVEPPALASPADFPTGFNSSGENYYYITLDQSCP